jgi:hypothetical protein
MPDILIRMGAFAILLSLFIVFTAPALADSCKSSESVECTNSGRPDVGVFPDLDPNFPIGARLKDGVTRPKEPDWAAISRTQAAIASNSQPPFKFEPNLFIGDSTETDLQTQNQLVRKIELEERSPESGNPSTASAR